MDFGHILRARGEGCFPKGEGILSSLHNHNPLLFITVLKIWDLTPLPALYNMPARLLYVEEGNNAVRLFTT